MDQHPALKAHEDRVVEAITEWARGIVRANPWRGTMMMVEILAKGHSSHGMRTAADLQDSYWNALDESRQVPQNQSSPSNDTK